MRRFLEYASSSIQAFSIASLMIAAVALPNGNANGESSGDTPPTGTSATCPCAGGGTCGDATYDNKKGYSCPQPGNCGAAANCQISVVINPQEGLLDP